MRFTVGFKLKALTGISVALLGAIAATGYVGASHAGEVFRSMAEAQAALQKSLQVDMNHDGLRGDVYFALHSSDPAAVSDVTNEMGERIESMRGDFYAIAKIARLDSRARGDDLKDRFEEARPHLDAYLAGARKMLEALRSGRDAADRQLAEFEESFGALVDPMEAMSDSITARAAEAADSAIAASDGTRTWIGWILVLSMVVLLLASHRIGSAILMPIRVVRDVLEAMANKRFDERVAIRGDDELAEMSAAANRTIDAVGRAVNEIAGGARRLTESSSSLQQVATQMEVAASRTHEHASRVAETSDRVRQNCESTAAGGGQMRQSIEEIARRCTDAAGAAQDAVRAAATARESMDSLLTKSREIGEVVRFISSIAEQTNLLALNATIESARAGESGRGFAVVAAEVKNLALETARSTGVVRDKVHAIQEETGRVGELIGQIDAVIQRIDGIQGTIAGAIQEQTATTSEMAESMTAVSDGAGGIKHSVDEVANHAKTANAASQAVARASTELSAIAGEMNRLVGEFRVDGGS
jgi:methyl-accepting chemotaxis protein